MPFDGNNASVETWAPKTLAARSEFTGIAAGTIATTPELLLLGCGRFAFSALLNGGSGFAVPFDVIVYYTMPFAYQLVFDQFTVAANTGVIYEEYAMAGVSASIGLYDTGGAGIGDPAIVVTMAMGAS